MLTKQHSPTAKRINSWGFFFLKTERKKKLLFTEISFNKV